MRQRIIQLCVSLFLGCLTTFLLFNMVRKEREKAMAQQTWTRVLRTKKYIKMGKGIELNALQEVAVPHAFLEPGAFQTKKDLFDAGGRPLYISRVGLQKGEQITGSKIMNEKMRMGLSWLLEKPQVASTLRLEPEEAVGGWVEPGDWVQVYEGFPRSRLLLERVQVLAVQDRLLNPVNLFDENNFSKPIVNESILVTLILTTQDVTLLNAAKIKGKLTLALLDRKI